MRDTIDHESTRPADPLSAIVVERDWLCAGLDQLLVHQVEHLQKGHVFADVIGRKGVESPLVVGPVLPPYVKCEIHYL